MPFVDADGNIIENPQIYEFTPDRPSFFRLSLISILGKNINQGLKFGYITSSKQLFLNTPSATQIRGGKKLNKRRTNKRKTRKSKKNNRKTRSKANKKCNM